MSVQPPLPVPIVQMGLVEKVAEVAQNKPIVQQQVAQEEAAASLKDKSVEPAQPSKKGSGVKTRDSDRRQQQSHGEKKDRHEPQQEEEEQEMSSPTHPFAGTLINVKV